MSVFIYKNGHWDCLAGNKIWSSQYQEWVEVKDGDQLRFNSRWHTISTNAWTSENNCKKTSIIKSSLGRGDVKMYFTINDGKLYVNTTSANYLTTWTELLFDNDTEWTCLGGYLYDTVNFTDFKLVGIKNRRLTSIYYNNSHYPGSISSSSLSDDWAFVSGGNDSKRSGYYYAMGGTNYPSYIYALSNNRLFWIANYGMGGLSSSTGEPEDINWTEVIGHSNCYGTSDYTNRFAFMAFAIGDGKLYQLFKDKYYLLNDNVGWSSLSGYCDYTYEGDDNFLNPTTINQYARAKYNNKWYKIGVNVVIPEEE